MKKCIDAKNGIRCEYNITGINLCMSGTPCYLNSYKQCNSILINKSKRKNTYSINDIKVK